jgi:hypothetical protein
MGAAALAYWLRSRQRPGCSVEDASVSLIAETSQGSLAIDDDTAADIIKRSRPALEKAREVAS